MTDYEEDDDVVCDICETSIDTLPKYDEYRDVYVNDEGDWWESVSDYLEASEEVALYNQEWNTYICWGCVITAYYIRHGAPIRVRLRKKWWALLRWRRNQWRRYKWKK